MMPEIELRIPETLRRHAGCFAEVAVSGETVRQAMDNLAVEQPKLYQSVCDETGSVRRHIHVFVNNDRIELQEPNGLDRSLKDGDVLTIWTAVSGG